MIEKKSKNNIQWRGGASIDDADEVALQKELQELRVSTRTTSGEMLCVNIGSHMSNRSQ